MQTIIRQAPFGVFLAMLGVPLAMAVTAILAGLKARQTAHAVADTPTVDIATADEGYRHIAGTAVAIEGEPLVAPLTGSVCVWYSIRVEEWKRPLPSVGRNEWVTVRSDVSTAPLLVQDDTGICLVRLFGSDITPTDRSQWTGATLEPEDRNPPRLGPGEPLHGMVQVSGLPHSRFRYREERIYPGDPILAVGRLTIRPDDEDELDLSTAERITKTELGKGGRGQPLVITTTASRTQAALSAAGSEAAFTFALLPLGAAVLVLLARFS